MFMACLASSPEKQPDGSLDLAGADGRLLVVVGKAGSFGSDVELMS